MRILLVHNFYSSEAPSGENVAFEAEKNLLEQNGHTVATFTRQNDLLRGRGLRGAIRGAASTPWNPFASAALRTEVQLFEPRIVHVHNTFPLISPAIFRAIDRRAARVLTLHNYRLVCPAAIPMRDGKVCTDCIDSRSVASSLRHGCYRGSRLATMPLAVNVALHRAIGTWRYHVDAFIALSDFQRQLMTVGGLAANAIHVKPNFYAGNPAVEPFNRRPGYLLYVGRLSQEKGVCTLIKAWRRWGVKAPTLRVVGDGPLQAELQQEALGLRVEFLGQISARAVREQIANASLLLLPSEGLETFGLVVIEAFALGTPVAVSNLGPLPVIVQNGVNGVVFEAGNPAALLAAVMPILENTVKLADMANRARQSFERLYNEQENYKMLMKIYRQAVQGRRTQLRGRHVGRV